ncbi:ATP-binding protein [Hymenobacter caeli]|uniref:histidine kinase n=1 Tax=Hymenobacter caeli TaxID=2735894 RepID=A0ABX2FWH5_9BACT|nr:ATP-binding protein [Hymenobacter caeli]NRT21337.1 signal transduction histidine kinase [Hymenobacter caeli]
MKHLLLLLLVLLSAGPCLAQPTKGANQTPDSHVGFVPRWRSLLTKGWRYHAGDDPTWARPDFDASTWDTLTLNRPVHAMPRATRAGVCWLRLRFRLADSLRQRNLALQFYRLGTADIYLNGRLLTDSAHRARTRGFCYEPDWLEVPANGPAEQVLAVRFVPWRLFPLLGTDRLPLLQARLLTQRQRQRVDTKCAVQETNYWVITTVFLLLTLLHYTFYLYNPTQRANRYFARYALGFCLATMGVNYGIIGFAILPSWQWSAAIAATGGALVTLSGFYLLRAMYSLFGLQPGRVYVGLVVIGCLVLPIKVLTMISPWAGLAALLSGILGLAEIVRITVRALRQRRRGARIIAAGFAGGLLIILLYTGLRLLGIYLSPSLDDWVSYAPILLPALAISLFLAREFALDAELLLVKLREVEHLSAQTIAQEQDKQALLAAQNDTLEHQVAERTDALQRSLTDLHATQAQLIQKEKMAGLGELTAGIAHEIQNPLNFVNNFSEVSTELVEELQQALAARDTAEATELASDVAQNLGKITEHGKRAAAIVRGMLEHSRTSTGERAPTDVNQLADEYLRLAYQGLRAKDKTFNAQLQTDFAPGLPLVEGVGADLGRVLLNLFSNAFYAVHQRQQANGQLGYVPTVSVRTKQVGDRVEIEVGDNGTGMPAEVQAKIFQPFFTTKPTGEGTGLGLSLSHDIIAQGHGGTLTVESQAGQGTTFTICLPS